MLVGYDYSGLNNTPTFRGRPGSWVMVDMAAEVRITKGRRHFKQGASFPVMTVGHVKCETESGVCALKFMK